MSHLSLLCALESFVIPPPINQFLVRLQSGRLGLCPPSRVIHWSKVELSIDRGWDKGSEYCFIGPNQRLIPQALNSSNNRGRDEFELYSNGMGWDDYERNWQCMWLCRCQSIYSPQVTHTPATVHTEGLPRTV